MFYADCVVSACLLGWPCRFDAKAKPNPKIQYLASKIILAPLCPEVLANLPTPRLPCERKGNVVLRSDGQDMTVLFRNGVFRAMLLTVRLGARMAMLKSKSPACGVGQIYDGTFTNTLCPGNGLWAEALMVQGIHVLNSDNLHLFPSLDDCGSWLPAKMA